jgi:hypothetical protein
MEHLGAEGGQLAARSVRAEGTIRGSAVMRPSTSVQISTRDTSSTAPSSAAVKSEPPRPSVVGTPSTVAPMKPCVTGRRPDSTSGTRHWRARSARACMYGVAWP